MCLPVCLALYLIRLKRRLRHLKERESGVSLRYALKTVVRHSKERNSGAALGWATRMRVVGVFGV